MKVPQNDILSLAPLVRKIAKALKRKLPPTVDVDDLIQEGFCGVMSAAQRYDTDMGVPFRYFAVMRAKGAMIDYLRSLDSMSTTRRAVFNRVQRSRDQFEGKHHRQPDGIERAEINGITLEELHVLESDGLASLTKSLDEPVTCNGEDGNETLGDQVPGKSPDPLHEVDSQERGSMLWAEVDQLGSASEIVRMLYCDGLATKHVARQFGVSDSRISQISSRSREDLRVSLLKSEPRSYWVNLGRSSK